MSRISKEVLHIYFVQGLVTYVRHKSEFSTWGFGEIWNLNWLEKIIPFYWSEQLLRINHFQRSIRHIRTLGRFRKPVQVTDLGRCGARIGIVPVVLSSIFALATPENLHLPTFARNCSLPYAKALCLGAIVDCCIAPYRTITSEH